MENTKEIKCPIFKAKNKAVERATQAINEVKDIKQKAALAQKLLKEAEDLLSCKSFSEKKAECEFCQYISKIRKETAKLILKANQL